jgi:acetylornithine deacetylase
LRQAALRAPIHVALSYDEEVGCLGIAPLLRDLADAGIRPDGCIVGEPTSMRDGHRAQGRPRVPLHRARAVRPIRRSHHSGLNAIEYAARVITFIQDLSWREEAQGLRARRPRRAVLDHLHQPDHGWQRQEHHPGRM